jgi:hypothetical protein
MKHLSMAFAATLMSSIREPGDVGRGEKIKAASARAAIVDLVAKHDAAAALGFDAATELASAYGLDPWDHRDLGEWP